jgi:hypothetical protein
VPKTRAEDAEGIIGEKSDCRFARSLRGIESEVACSTLAPISGASGVRLRQ